MTEPFTKKEVFELINKLEKQAKQAQKDGDWLLAAQYLWDMNNVLPKKYRVNIPPPPRPEDD